MKGGGAVEINEASNINIQNGLALGQQGLHLESIKLFNQAIEFYTKAVIIFQKEIHSLNSSLQPTIQSIIISYQNKIQSIEARETQEQNSEVENLLTNIDMMDPYQSNTITSLFDQKEDNLFKVHLGDSINAQVVSFESLLNIVDEADKVRLTVQLLLRSMVTGVNLSKRIFINPLVWYTQAKIPNIEDRMGEFQEITTKIQQILVSNKYCMSAELAMHSRKLRTDMVAIYKKSNDSKTDDQGQTATSTSTKISAKFDKYAAGFLKSFQNIYKPTKEIVPTEYVRTVFKLLRALSELFDLFRHVESKQLNGSFESFQKDVKFIHIFTRDYFVRTVISDLNLKFNSFLTLSKSKQN